MRADDSTAPAAPGFTGRRWLLPSALAAELAPDAGHPGRPHRRTARDWIVDFLCFLVA
ncbi:sensor histidine kinase, partial [Streptomyces sp. NPDC054962]